MVYGIFCKLEEIIYSMVCKQMGKKVLPTAFILNQDKKSADSRISSRNSDGDDGSSNSNNSSSSSSSNVIQSLLQSVVHDLGW